MAKLSRHLVRQGKQPMLVAADLQRPAAIEQLQTLGERIASRFSPTVPSGPRGGSKAALKEANQIWTPTWSWSTRRKAADRPRADGRVGRSDKASNPTATLLVIDAMTGQDAVNVAKGFLEYVKLTGIILSKLDGDARGGAAHFGREVTGSPIKFAGVGEKLDDFEVFHPDRMAISDPGHG